MYGVIKYIEEHIQEKITLEDVASFAGYSKWYFCSLFRRFTGESFIEYVNERKMQYAAIDILSGETVTEVAFKYGFETSRVSIEEKVVPCSTKSLSKKS